MSPAGWTERFAAAERRLGVRRTAMVVWAMWMTWQVTVMSIAYAERMTDAASIAACAAVIGAIQVPVTTLAGIVCRDYFRDKQRPAEPRPPA